MRTRRTAETFFLTSIGGIDSVAFSPDGKTLLVGGKFCYGQPAGTSCAELWNAATGAKLGAPLAGGGLVLDGSVLAAFSPNGTTIATAGSAGTVQLWNAATHRRTGPAIAASPTGVEALAVSPRGGTLAIGGDDGTVRVWNAATWHEVGPDLPAGTDPGTGVAFGPDDTILASADTDGTARQWSLAALEGHPAAFGTGAVADGATGGVALGPSAQVVTSDDVGDVSVWSAASQDSPVNIVSPSPPGSTDAPQIAVSPGGRWLVTGDDDGTIRLWNLPSGATRPAATIPIPQTVEDGNLSLAGGIAALAFSPDGKEFAAAYIYGDVQVFDTATGQPAGQSLIGVFSTGGLLALAFAPRGGDLITVDTTGTVTTWNPRTSEIGDQIVTSTTVSFGSEPDAAALSPDAQTLAVGYPDGTVRLWDIATNEQIGNPIVAADGDIQSLAFGPDGTRLASAGDDGTVRLWDVSYLSPARDLAKLAV